jgi:hypothetical protein
MPKKGFLAKAEVILKLRKISQYRQLRDKTVAGGSGVDGS